MSDVYSFGVVLLELMTGRKALDKNRPRKEQSLVEWARPFLKDPVKLEGIMDTRLGLKGPPDPDHDHDVPKLGVAARKTASLAHQCLSQQAKCRPTMLRVVKALETIINLHNSFNNNNIQPHNVYVDQTKDQKFMINESHEDYKLQNNINIIIDQEEEEEEEQEQDQGHKKKQRPRRKGYRHKHRLSSLKYSRTVSSDTALYPTLVQNDQSLLLNQHNHDNSI